MSSPISSSSPRWRGRLSTANWRPRLSWFVSEIVIVFAGVLIALAINAWWTERQDRARERSYVHEVIRNLQEAESSLVGAIRGMMRTRHATSALLQATSDPEAAERPAFDLEATRQLIAQQNERFTNAHLTGDIATIDSMFTPDAKAYPPDAPAVSGIEAMHDFTVEYLKAGLSEFREQTTDFYGNAEYVVDAGTCVVTYGPDDVTERGKYMNVWKQVNGSWKIKANMWNTDGPSSRPE